MVAGAWSWWEVVDSVHILKLELAEFADGLEGLRRKRNKHECGTGWERAVGEAEVLGRHALSVPVGLAWRSEETSSCEVV